MIEAGTREQIKWGDGNWVFLDVGFSATKPSCGLIIGETKPVRIQFGDATRRIVEHVDQETHLVIEAPFRSPSMQKEIQSGGDKGQNNDTILARGTWVFRDGRRHVSSSRHDGCSSGKSSSFI
jgi:hypothetical protein